MPFRLSGGGGEIRHRGPDLGRDDVRIRSGLLGRPEDEIAPLVEESLGTAFEVE